ncbi:MAG: hypothetical protein HY688_02990 [Chloroflexi bacterium]|nr:hypothetical protein [Chloroflexota bacterium]
MIAEAALSVPRRPRDEVAKNLKDRIGAMGEREPAHDTLVKMISAARHSGQSDLDKPWSLGALTHHELPTHAINDVVEIWKLCLAVGWILTIRQAKWIARLRQTMPSGRDLPEDPGYWRSNLYTWAHIYALREQATEALGIPNETNDLDFDFLLMSTWEWFTALAVGDLQSTWRARERPSRLLEKEIAIESQPGRRGGITWGMPHDVVEAQLDMYEAPQLEEHQFSPSAEASKVYAYWLRHLSRGPQWENLPFERRLQIVVRLREEVQAVDAATQAYMHQVPLWLLLSKAREQLKLWGVPLPTRLPKWSIDPEPGPVPAEFDLRSDPPFFAWKPKDLLREVGYEE